MTKEEILKTYERIDNIRNFLKNKLETCGGEEKPDAREHMSEFYSAMSIDEIKDMFNGSIKGI